MHTDDTDKMILADFFIFNSSIYSLRFLYSFYMNEN